MWSLILAHLIAANVAAAVAWWLVERTPLEGDKP